MRQRLGVNVDHVATIRQARRAMYPDPVDAALVAERAGADQITVHLREDRRHIQDRDVQILRSVTRTVLNLEMAATQDMIKFALEVRPDIVTLVPERREELTTEGGLDVAGGREHLIGAVRMLEDASIPVSVFVDPDVEQVKGAHKLGATAIELHTGPYAEAPTPQAKSDALKRLVDAAKLARKLGLEVAAGHGLDYHNVQAVAAIPEIAELNIGHSIVARAVIDGMDRAVRDMIALMAGLG